jgi:hypothetical protein
MGWLASIGIALLSGVLGVVCAGIVAAACVSWYRISSFEGGSGYFVVAIAFLGGVAGFIIGLAMARVVAAGAGPGFLRALGLSSATVIGIAAIAALICWQLADIPPRINGQYLNLEVEIRLPAGETNSPASVSGDSHLHLGSLLGHTRRKSETGQLNLADARFEDGRWIIPGSVHLFTMRGKRMFDADLGGKQVAGFVVPLPARPGKRYEQWSGWQPQPRPGYPPWPDTESSYRFRVVRQIPPPPPSPPPDPKVVEAEKFAALKPDSPLQDWLIFLTYGAPEDRVKAVMKIVEERPQELASAIGSSEDNVRELALNAVASLTRVTPEVSGAVLAEGRSIAEGIRGFNTMKADDPNFYNVQLNLRTRFSYWHRAWWTVHQKTGVDGRPPVQEILDLALVRAKEPSMDEIIANARAHLGGLPSANKKETPTSTP